MRGPQQEFSFPETFPETSRRRFYTVRADAGCPRSPREERLSNEQGLGGSGLAGARAISEVGKSSFKASILMFLLEKFEAKVLLKLVDHLAATGRFFVGHTAAPETNPASPSALSSSRQGLSISVWKNEQ